MRKDDCFFIGIISKTSGLAGELVLQLDVEDPDKYRKLESVLLELGGTLTPFFVKSIRLSGRAALLRLEGIDTPERAADLVRAEAYLPLSMLPPLKGNRFYFHEIEGFEAIDAAYGLVGTVNHVLEFPHQLILSVQNGVKEVLIPLVDEVIERVDRDARKLYIKAPEGLIGIYLDESRGEEDL